MFAAGAVVGFLSGLLGLGGGIVLFPALYYLPQYFGIASFEVKHITGLTMAQGFSSALAAAVLYHSRGFVNKRLVLYFGGTLCLSALAGSALSAGVSDRGILLVFGALSMVAAVLMVLPRNYDRDETPEGAVKFNVPLAIGIGSVLGYLLGMVGQGGAFIIIPTLLYALGIPMRVAMGSTLAISFISSTGGMAGKLWAGQVMLVPALIIVAASLPMARLGAAVGMRMQTRTLKWMLAAVIVLTALRILAG